MKSAAESKVFSRNYSLNIQGRLLDLRIPKVMGILNLTPDSFYQVSRVQDEKQILTIAGQMLEDGAAILDLGGHSTRPGATRISVQEEVSRIIPAVKSILKHFPEAILSCDTFQSEVAEAAAAEGASMVNDVSGGELDKKMFEAVSRLKLPYVLMHMRGTPETMAGLNEYENIHLEVTGWLQQKLKQLVDLGVHDIIADPGFGFSKSSHQNYQLLNKFELFHALDCPLLVGVSRKSMIWKILQSTPDQALNGTTVLNTIALMKGASILRVHDVKEAVEAIRLFTLYHNA